MQTQDNRFSLIVAASDAGDRLDRYLFSKLSDTSRSHAAKLIACGAVLVNTERKRPAYCIKAGDLIVGVQSAETAPMYPVLPEHIDLDIIYEDTDLIVVNKPAGLVVHPAPGHYQGTLVNALMHHCPDLKSDQMDLRPGIVHRLDKDTSGLIVVAKNRLALNGLSAQFKQRIVKKSYLAVVEGRIKSENGAIELPIGRHPVDRKKMSVIAAKGRWALTEWSVLRRLKDATLVQVQIKTGRTHQIRVHLAAIQHPVIGDAVYGRRRQRAGRQMLHAWQLSLVHPVDNVPMHFTAAVPQDIQDLIRKTGRKEDVGEFIAPTSGES
jgi:23S rRNA pseudouridine1911/1915/1917 synthase